jgi:Putative peptidoglycan binding domain
MRGQRDNAAPFSSFRMRNGIFVFLIAIAGAAMALPQSATTYKKTATSKKAAPHTQKTAVSTQKTAAKKKSSSSKKSGTKTAGKNAAATSAKNAAAWHPRQMTPTPERYREIQQALVDKGYLKSEPTGVWDAQSIDALRQFQADKKLSVTGRISSASLISLGLGPGTHSEATPAVPPAALPPEPAPPTENR